MTTRTTGRRASAKIAAGPVSAKTKAPRAAPLKRTAAVTLPVTRTTARKRRVAKSSKAATAPVAPAGTKQARLIALLRAQPGATIAQMTALTGWQPHTVRGTTSGVLRKRLGLNLACGAESGVSIYRILGPVASA